MTVSNSSNYGITMMQEQHHSRDVGDGGGMVQASDVQGDTDGALSKNKYQHHHEGGDGDGDIESGRDGQHRQVEVVGDNKVNSKDNYDNDGGGSSIVETKQEQSKSGFGVDDMEMRKESSSSQVVAKSAVLTKEALKRLEAEAENDVGPCYGGSTQQQQQQHQQGNNKAVGKDGDDDADSARSSSDRAAIERRIVAPEPPSPSRSSSSSSSGSPIYERYEMGIKDKQQSQDEDDIFDVIESNTSASIHEVDTSSKYYSDDSLSYADQQQRNQTSTSAGEDHNHHHSGSSSTKRQLQHHHRRVSFNQKNIVQTTTNHSEEQTNTRSSTHHHTRAKVNTYSRGSNGLSKAFCGGIFHNTCCTKYHAIILPVLGMLFAISLMMIVVSVILVYKNR